ncbi:hypothetical protein N7495_001119, partial [Penicillium taxi]|uniref:uncharacterized protein n=1 Tax=Penicillium taxi TaxID=168475 RepID=UPI00254570E5
SARQLPNWILISILVNTRRSEYNRLLISYFEHIIRSSSTLVDNAYYNPYQLPALEHHNHALSHLTTNLKADNRVRSEGELDKMLGQLSCCISDCSRSSWVTHKGFQDMIRARQERPGRSVLSQELMNFLTDISPSTWSWARIALAVDDAPCDLPNIMNPYMGLSHSLLLLINQVSELAWAQEDKKDHVIIVNIFYLKKILENLDQKVPDEDIDSITSCADIAEVNRLGALLLHEICKDDIYPTSLSLNEHNDYVEQILGLILSNKASMMRRGCSLLASIIGRMLCPK